MEYRLIRSKRKTLALQITRELEIVVRAPHRASRSAIDRFAEAHQGWISAHLERQRRYLLENPEPTAEEAARLRASAAEYIPRRVAHYGRIMGLVPVSVKITAARTRFGSCSGKNRLCFSYRLMRYPPDAVDYVVVHELAHIAHKNHGGDFYALVASVLPDYLARRAILRGPV